MTHPTKSIYKLILQDYVKVSTISVEDTLYDESDLQKSMDKIEVVNYHQIVHHKGIKFWCYNAGHVLGAAMFFIEIAGVKILYTGDYSRREDRHLMAGMLLSQRLQAARQLISDWCCGNLQPKRRSRSLIS
jgi:cleavage and polyadenylation specificity factor subunit 3